MSRGKVIRSINCFIYTFLLLALCDILLCASAYSKNYLAIEHIGSVEVDNSRVEVRTIPVHKINTYRLQKDFIYENQQRGFTWWERFKIWIWSKIVDVFAIDEKEFTIKNIYFYLLMGIFIIVMAAVLFRIDLRGIFYTSKKIAVSQVLDIDNNIHLVNFDRLLQHYLTRNDYRGAVRVLYKKTLKELTEKNIIQWKENKTNREYVREVHNAELQTVFKEVTGLFEHVWYGHLELDTHSFNKVRKYFLYFNRLVAKRV